MKSRNMENYQIKNKNPRKTRSAPAVVYRGYYYEKKFMCNDNTLQRLS